MKCSIKDIVDFYNEFPEEIGNIKVLTRYGFKTIEFADITAQNSKIVQIITESGKLLECSPEHQLFSQNWIPANKLNIGSKVLTCVGEESIQSIKILSETEDLYDLQVEEVHEFYANGLVSHNSLIGNALSYALYSWPISDIKKEHLVNMSNEKNMLVTLDFESNGKNYRIVRGLKPRVLQFFEEGTKTIDAYADTEDSSQGDSRETQKEIEKVIGMSHDMFCQLIAINTYTQPFLFQKIADQRSIIEQLLGITLLSEKADKLKEEVKIAKDNLIKEDARIKAVQSANKRIQDQIDSLKRKQKGWIRQKEEDLKHLESKIEKLSKIDIDNELIIHEKWDLYNNAEKERNFLSQQQKQIQISFNKEQKNFNQIKKDLESLDNQCCQTCGQKLDTQIHKELLLKTNLKLESSKKELSILQQSLDLLLNSISKIPNLDEPDPKNYETINEVHDHKNKLMLLIQEYQQKQNEFDPYQQQIESMENNALEEIDMSILNSLSKFIDHQDFLMKLLTNKDSFIRKKIIDQNLNYLNTRLNYYLNALGLPHEVIFQNDLSVEINQLGKELSPGNLSRGEMARLSLGLNFAFRDVYESIYQNINLLYCDEKLDDGIDSNGSENAMNLLRDMSRELHKSVWVISHKEEMVSKSNVVMKVVKENGFTSFAFED